MEVVWTNLSQGGRTMSIKAFIFDLYGTLIVRKERQFIHQIIQYHPRQLLGGQKTTGLGSLVVNMKQRLMATDLSTQSIPQDVLALFASTSHLPPAQIEHELRESLLAESCSAKLFPGVKTILTFLKRRGYRIGVVSNVSTYHKDPFFRFGLDRLVDAAVFSCDVGIIKPETAIYLEACNRLGVTPKEVVFVGDSYKMDVKIPLSLGMKAIHISKSSRENLSIAEIAEMGLVIVREELSHLKHGLHDERLPSQPTLDCQTFTLLNSPFGKTSLTYRCDGFAHGSPAWWYLKRYLDPTTIPLIETAYRLAQMTGLQELLPTTLEVDGEPFLLLPHQDGTLVRKGMQLSPDTLYHVGRHAAFAYMFSNMTFHPSSLLLTSDAHHPSLTVLNFDRCFLEKPYIRRFIRRTLHALVGRETPAKTPGVQAIQEGIASYLKEIHPHRPAILDMLQQHEHSAPRPPGDHPVLTSADIERINARMQTPPEQVIDAIMTG
ncbi:HAD-IA family hydrolase [candidate division KSB3 bacterium]|uniref:HAD-IA family hydrolase n=1 Tax=candidate division KSB3 bacterium TaxID=2044937 RepID=A0A9D5Q7M3_9BACT|nr:HAD-IA family hydrolase [candidate division KSB3 bacterium]MBD3327029.1 HAD-IA family hydrolase [candidate division KSB3 bacterium]